MLSSQGLLEIQSNFSDVGMEILQALFVTLCSFGKFLLQLLKLLTILRRILSI